MNVVVCVKQIPDPNNPYQMENGRLKRSGVQNVLDPGDEYGVEAALKLVEQGGGEVTAVSMGPASAMEAIRKALSMGAAKGILVTDESLPGADALVTARVLAAAIKKAGEFDLVIAGVEPRYPTFKGIMQAKSKPVDQVSVSDLGLSGDDAKATQTVEQVAPAPERGAGEKFEDDGTGAAKIADFLKNAKVI